MECRSGRFVWGFRVHLVVCLLACLHAFFKLGQAEAWKFLCRLFFLRLFGVGDGLLLFCFKGYAFKKLLWRNADVTRL